eukprot:360953_1
MATARSVQSLQWIIKSRAICKSCNGNMSFQMNRIQYFSNQQKMQSNSNNKKRTFSSFKSYAYQKMIDWRRNIVGNPQFSVPIGVIGLGVLLISIHSLTMHFLYDWNYKNRTFKAQQHL